jgi:DNA-binding SARP family transcriptional activator
MALPKPDLFDRVDPDARRPGALVVARDLSTADRAARLDPDSAPPDVPPYGRFGPGFPINLAKVQRPALRDDTLARPRLLDWLAANIHHRVVFITAEAGYGKTTLLADFARRTRLRLLWYRIDEQDRDWIGLLNYLVAAGRQASEGFAPITASLLGDLGAGASTRERIVETFLGELQSLAGAPTVVILDDWHLLDGVLEVRQIIRTLIDRAPDGMSFVFASRRRPAVSAARYRARGEVAELGTTDLRFSHEETGRLFRETYQQPLASDTLSALSARTEGWAASLQLVQAAIRNRTQADARTFVRGLTGIDENLYDYLAEEVVGDLETDLQDFLMRTSILQEVNETLASVVGEMDTREATSLIDKAERMGLLIAGMDPTAHSDRYHPLVREFLLHRLQRDFGDLLIRDLHRAVARHAEGSDWRLATYHFAQAGDIDDLHRVIESSVFEIMSSGDYAQVDAWIGQYPPEHIAVVHEIARSRLDFYKDRLGEALEHAEAAANLSSGHMPETRDLSQLNLAGLRLSIGDAEGTVAVARPLLASAIDPMVRDIATAFILMIEANRDGSLRTLSSHLLGMAHRQRAAGRRFFAGVSYLNAANAFKSIGDAGEAERCGTEAYELLASDPPGPEQCSAASVVAWALAASGRLAEASKWLSTATAVPHVLTRLESLSEAADIQSWFGSAAEAAQLALLARSLGELAPPRMGLVIIAEAELALRVADTERARRSLDSLSMAHIAVDIGMVARLSYMRALLAWRAGSSNFQEAVDAASRHAAIQDADLWSSLTRMLSACEGPPEVFSQVLVVESKARPYALSMAAELILPRLGDLNETALSIVSREVLLRPQRWRAGLRDLVDRDRGASAGRAAHLLDHIGESEDITRLRRYVKISKVDGESARVGKNLARKLASHIYVEDQNRVRIAVGTQVIEGASIRRKVLSLLCFLLSRPGFAAAKDQVLDALWPDLEPDVAANSLNQTIYFLRRVFEPQYKDDLSAEYVHHESDVLWLDRDLIDSRSARCDALMSSLTDDLNPATLIELSRTYVGPFALEFLYEEWAVAYRTTQHSRYLQLIERSSRRDLGIGQFDRAIALLEHGLKVDPDADQLEALLVHLYRRTGANAAAAERYAHYASVLRRDLGVEPPGLEAM